MPDSTALLISNDSSLVDSCQEVIQSIAGLRLDVVSEIDEAERYPSWDDVGLVVVHISCKSAIEEVTGLLRRIGSLERPMATLVVSEQHEAKQALTLLRLGVAEYLSRPLDLSRLAYLIDTLTVRARHTALRQVPALPAVQTLGSKKPLLFLRSGVMGRLLEQVRLVAPQETTVLLGGETGTGKTRLAHLIHELSPRHDQRFMVIHCGALALNLIESEMFGHVKGAFTGADRERTGKFADVGDGTVLLDDIDALPLPLQAKLLRVVEERVFEPVGSNQPVPMCARLIVASNRALEEEVEAGRFRSDLYYRLNVVCFSLPPLREQRPILQPMIAHLLNEFAVRSGRPVHGISDEALHVLQTHEWPGNLRELRNVIERAVVLCPGPEIQLSDLPEAICPGAARVHLVRCDEAEEPVHSPDCSTLGQARGEAEAQRITEALRKHGNNRLRAAAELGISRMTLYKKLHKYGLTGAVWHFYRTTQA